MAKDDRRAYDLAHAIFGAMVDYCQHGDTKEMPLRAMLIALASYCQVNEIEAEELHASLATIWCLVDDAGVRFGVPENVSN